MDEDRFYPQDSIAALATPWGESALAVIRLSGLDSLRLLSSLFEPASATGKILDEVPGHTVHRGVITAPGENGQREIVDEVLVAVYRGPKSFTGEDGAELFCHGSPIIIRRLLGLLEEAGFRFAGPGEFTLRAFLNRKLDLTQAEAVNEVVRAKTDRARAIALNRLSGAIEQKIDQIKSILVRLSAAVELRLDYPDDEIEEGEKIKGEDEIAQQELERLLSTYRIGKIYQEGISVVLAGSTNSGKSTLFNRMLREDRAIVSEIHGTTRDYLEGVVSLEGNADIILYLVDAESGFTRKDEEFLQSSGSERRLIPVWNKIDRQSSRCPAGFVPISAKEGDGLEDLGRGIVEKVLAGAGMVDSGEPIIDSLRQKRLLGRALQGIKDFRAGLRDGQPWDVLAVDLKEALDALGEITGEITSQDILNQIFSQFCVGK
jgi:tRNA modification GTPase